MGNNIIVNQGAFEKGMYGDFFGIFAESCGLILVFSDDNQSIIAYHIPGMDASDYNLQRLSETIEQSGGVTKVIIFSHMFPNQEEEEKYKDNARKIAAFSHNTSYFTTKSISGMIYVETTVDGDVERLNEIFTYIDIQ